MASAEPTSFRCHGTAGGGSSAGRVIPGMRPRSTTLPHFGHVASGRTVDGVRNLLQLVHQGIAAIGALTGTPTATPVPKPGPHQDPFRPKTHSSPKPCLAR